MSKKRRSVNTRYRGRRIGSSCVIERLDAGIPGNKRGWIRLSPAESLRLRNHSPSGFEWGYGGSGPAQTALALLLDFTRDPKAALANYQDLKSSVIAGLDLDEWELTGAQLNEALSKDLL